ncbi:MAG: iron-sulfur cluster assembly accessory protein [Ignavibacteriae bacterium]|nr:iron-sulfur cluster assembly accessory protein [Ignavibacteriota bacterium]
MTETITDTMTETGVEFERIPTGVEGADSDEDILISQSAINEIHNILESSNVPDGYFLRIGTRGGGCSGMSYVLGFDARVGEEDRVFTSSNLRIAIDSKSLFYMMGVTIDFIDDVQGKGFTFTSPNSSLTCGCHG